MDFDEDRIYFSHQNLHSGERREDNTSNSRGDNSESWEDKDDDEDGYVDLDAVRRHFREFLRSYRQASGQSGYIYRERLLRMHRRTSGEESNPKKNGCSIRVELAHVGEYDSALLGLLLSRPNDVLPQFELAAKDALKTFLHDLKADSDSVGSVQILLKGNLAATPLRSIRSKHVNKLLRVPGIIISAARVRSRAHIIAIRCARCSDTTTIQALGGPFASVPLPTRCQGPNPQECGPVPYGVLSDECTFIDQQTLKLQESPESVPTGEMPRSILLAAERGLVDTAPPGTRVNILAVANLFNAASSSKAASVRTLYLRVLGMTRETTSADNTSFTPREEEAFRLLARRPDIYNILTRSIAPSISGSYTIDIKKALTCLLFSGSRKRLPDGMRLRGDINVLLLGDPSTAKSQFLKFTTRVAPIAVYTSGKGSSAAGLTASVIRDAKGEFYLEGGAMVLADGGVVCIDEFDKMRPADRVAIHEAMEQQTISIAKAGITTVLNSRCSVLAAANPVFGRYDDLKSASENIDLMSTILSRFDLIFLVRDIRDEQRDRSICLHVMGVHIDNYKPGGATAGSGLVAASNALQPFNSGDDALLGGTGAAGSNSDSLTDTNSSASAIAENAMRIATTGVGELNVSTMKKYIQYCRAKCSPRLTEEAGDVLTSSYVKIRDDVRRRTLDSDGGEGSHSVIPITVRQLEALVRLSESLAKMRLDSDVQTQDVAEALRLFKVSTMAANQAERSTTSSSSNNSNPSSQSIMSAAIPSRDDMMRSESFLRSRLVVGMVVNRQKIIEEAAGQGYNAMVIARALAVMVMRGEVQERNQSRLIKRVK